MRTRPPKIISGSKIIDCLNIYFFAFLVPRQCCPYMRYFWSAGEYVLELCTGHRLSFPLFMFTQSHLPFKGNFLKGQSKKSRDPLDLPIGTS